MGYGLVRRLQNIVVLFWTAKRGNTKTTYFNHFTVLYFSSCNSLVQIQVCKDRWVGLWAHDRKVCTISADHLCPYVFSLHSGSSLLPLGFTMRLLWDNCVFWILKRLYSPQRRCFFTAFKSVSFAVLSVWTFCLASLLLFVCKTMLFAVKQTQGKSVQLLCSFLISNYPFTTTVSCLVLDFLRHRVRAACMEGVRKRGLCSRLQPPDSTDRGNLTRCTSRNEI